jgi:SAM-dependent methyltransferase
MTEGDWGARRTSFGDEADAYARGRPSYPDEAIGWILPPDARTVLDLAAGTGRLTEVLLARGLDVIAVEPLDAMRAHIPGAATALAGTAEQIPVDDASVDCVVVGQAFHWFDAPAAMAEIARVLRPGGTIGLLWNLCDDADPLTMRICEIVGDDEMRASIINPDQPPPYSDVAGASRPQRRLFAHGEPYDVERLVAWALSMSRTILLPRSERDQLLSRIRAELPEDSFVVRQVCEVWRGERNG